MVQKNAGSGARLRGLRHSNLPPHQRRKRRNNAEAINRKGAMSSKANHAPSSTPRNERIHCQNVIFPSRREPLKDNKCPFSTTHLRPSRGRPECTSWPVQSTHIAHSTATPTRARDRARV